MANMIDIQGANKGQIALPSAFSEKVRNELIRRAVLAENTYKLQPQGHFLLAGMQTTATYYGAMHEYRSGRHMGDAIRPRQKLGGGVQGDVRKIPSATKGRRAHPHMIEKTIVENINRREYQNAIKSAVAATISENASVRSPIIFTNEIEAVAKTKDVVSILGKIGLSQMVESSHDSKRVKKGLKRSTKQKIYKRSVLFVVSGGKILNSARNLAGVDVCKVEDMTANLLAPGGNLGRTTVWSENAIKKLDSTIKELSIS
jgi:large subunit ribosomal protein L4e